MPRRNRKKRQKHLRSSFALTEESENLEEKCTHESPMVLIKKDDFKKRPSLGSSAVMKKISREISSHKDTLKRKFESAINGTGDWRNNPEAMQRLSELRAFALKKGEQ